LSLGAVRDALGRWIRSPVEKRPSLVACVDGKTQRGTGQHVLHVFLQDFWFLVDLEEVGAKKNETSTFRDHLATLVGRYPFLQIFTFDALFCQHAIAETLTAQGRRALFQVKKNQRITLHQLERHFRAVRRAARPPEVERVEKKKPLYGASPVVG
jgi:hypothetical protein